MSRRIQPAVIFVVCDGCEVVAAPEPLHVLASDGWTVSRDEPTGYDWCPQCTRIVRLVAEDTFGKDAS